MLISVELIRLKSPPASQLPSLGAAVCSVPSRFLERDCLRKIRERWNIESATPDL